jgi:hypothetical protein
VKGRVAVFAGAAAAAAGALAARLLRRQPPAPVADPRADELRQRLEESRAVVSAREELEEGETPVDQAEPATDVEARRREIHDRAQAAAEEMRRDD